MPAIKVLTALDQARTHYYHFKAGHRTSSSTWVSLHQPIRSLPHRARDEPHRPCLLQYYYDPSDRGRPGSRRRPWSPSPWPGRRVIGNVALGTRRPRGPAARVYGTCLLLMVCSSVRRAASPCAAHTAASLPASASSSAGTTRSRPPYDHVRVRQQAHARRVHRRRVLHAGVRDTGELRGHHGRGLRPLLHGPPYAARHT
jgi:hypothetical protein